MDYYDYLMLCNDPLFKRGFKDAERGVSLYNDYYQVLEKNNEILDMLFYEKGRYFFFEGYKL